MELDFQTLLSVSASAYFAHGLCVLLIWHYHRSIPGLRQWAGHYLLISIGLILVLLTPWVPRLISVVVANVTQCMAYLALYDGLRRFFGRRGVSHRCYWVFGAGTSLLFGVLLWHYPSLQFRAIAHYALGAALYAAMTVEVAPTTAANRTSSPQYNAVLLPHRICLFQSLFMAGMALYWALHPEITQLAAAVPLYTLMVFDAMLVSLFLLVALGLMVAQRYHTALSEQAVRDPLTGLYNRRGFDALASHDLRRRLAPDEHLFVAIADLDNFKVLNDTYGHYTGDQALRVVAAVLAHLVREGDLVGRYGGEEFYFMLSGITADHAEDVLERCRETVARTPIDHPDGEIFITISIGYARRCSVHEGFDSMMARADNALYRAKIGGKNRICLSDSSL